MRWGAVGIIYVEDFVRIICRDDFPKREMPEQKLYTKINYISLPRR